MSKCECKCDETGRHVSTCSNCYELENELLKERLGPAGWKVLEDAKTDKAERQRCGERYLNLKVAMGEAVRERDKLREENDKLNAAHTALHEECWRMEDALKKGADILDGIKAELEASVYTLTDDEFERTFYVRDILQEALSQSPLTQSQMEVRDAERAIVEAATHEELPIDKLLWAASKFVDDQNLGDTDRFRNDLAYSAKLFQEAVSQLAEAHKKAGVK